MKQKVYICAPLGGDVKGNIRKVMRYTEYALKVGVAPVVSHFYALCLDDNSPEERKLGLEAGQSLLWFCDAIWIFGDEITEGMKEEIQFCKNLHVPMKKIGYNELKKVLGEVIYDKTEMEISENGCGSGSVAVFDNADDLCSGSSCEHSLC